MNKQNLEKTIDVLKKEGFYAMAGHLAQLRGEKAEAQKDIFAAYLEGLAYMLDEDLRDLQNIFPDDENYMFRLEEIIALRNLLLIALPSQDFSALDYIDAVYKFHTHDNSGAKSILERVVNENPANHWNALLQETQKRQEQENTTYFEVDAKNKNAVSSKIIQLIGQPEELLAFLNFVKKNASADVADYAMQIITGLAEQQGYDERNFRIMLVYANVLHRVEQTAQTYLMRAISYFFLNNFYQAKYEIEQAVKMDDSIRSREDYKFVAEKLKQIGV